MPIERPNGRDTGEDKEMGKMGEPSIDSLHDPYEDQLSAARFKAERDQLRQELTRIKRGPQVTMSAYDLLPEEDLQALRWVREQGGLNVLKVYTDFFENLLRECREYRDLVRDYEKRGGYDLPDEGEREVLRIWPRYEDGEPVRFGDRVKYRRGTCVVESMRFYMGGGVTVYGNDNDERVVVTEPVFHDPVERADAQVFAADGEPLEVGQTVWHVSNGIEFIVVGLPKSGEYQAVKLRLDDGAFTWFDPDQLTHQRPVLDADGVRIDLGDDLYSVEGGLKLHVSNIDKVGCRIATSAMFALDKWADPSMFTHTKPEVDTWQRIEEDAERIDETRQWGDRTPDVRDLVRRCKELARKENNNE